jgi:O-antigen ligase
MDKGRNFLFITQLGVIASLPFHFLFSSYAVILLVIAFLYNIKEQSFRLQVWTQFKLNRISLLFLVLFMLYPLSFLLHLSDYQNTSSGLSEIEKKLSYLLFPILFASVAALDSKKIILIFKVFVGAVLISTVFAISMGLYSTLASGSLYYYDPNKQVVFNNFMYHRLGSYVGLHAVYLAEYVLFSLAITVHYGVQHFKKWTLKKRVLYFVLISYFLLIIFLLKSAAILIILLASILVFFIYYLAKYSSSVSLRAKVILPIIAIFLIATLGMRAYKKIGFKANYFTYDLAEPGGGNWNAINLRLAKWDATLIAIKNNWLLGVGPGNTEHIMDKTYKNIGFDYALQLHYNPHNQFLHTFLALGIFGISTLCMLIASLLVSSFRKKDVVFIIFLVSLALFSVSESTLAVNKGIVFFTLFGTIFSYLPKKLSDYVG